MSLSAFLVQLLNGLAGASSLFLVAAGLSLIFGVTRIVNFAHGSFYMLGHLRRLVAGRVAGRRRSASGPACCWRRWWSGVLGAAVELLVLRRIYRAPELFQLLATFALVLIFKDAALWWWGPEDLLGPRAPGLSGAVTILGRAFPTYDLFLIAGRAAGAGHGLAAAAPHALGNAGTRRHAGPRHAVGAGREPGLAVHQRVCAGLHAGGVGRRPATAPRAGQPGPGHGNDRRCLRRRRRRRHGFARPAPIWPRC